MMDEEHKAEWRVLGKSIRGASHVRTGLPNQDAICWLPESGMGPPLILAIADGHGSAQYFRSDQGAQLAVRTATVELQQFRDGQLELSNLSAVKRTAEERLPQHLVRAWREAVAAHMAEHPFTEEEWARLVEQKGGGARQAIEANPTLAYGATLLTVLVTDAFILYLQLGDGDILTVTEQGQVARPLPTDDRLIANETTSLCTHNAWKDFRMGFQVLVETPPALILLATDGYANSFPDEAGFLKVGSDLLGMIRSEGLDQVNAQLEHWLSETSQGGSGDDITLGIIRRAEPESVHSSLPPMASLETGPESRADQTIDFDERQKPLEDFHRTLRQIRAQNQRISNRMTVLLWGLVAASCLSIAAFALSIVLWVRSTGVTPTGGQMPGVPPPAQITDLPV